MFGILIDFIRCRGGSTAAEYGLIASLAAVLLLLFAQDLGVGLGEVLHFVTSAAGSGPQTGIQ